MRNPRYDLRRSRSVQLSRSRKSSFRNIFDTEVPHVDPKTAPTDVLSSLEPQTFDRSQCDGSYAVDTKLQANQEISIALSAAKRVGESIPTCHNVSKSTAPPSTLSDDHSESDKSPRVVNNGYSTQQVERLKLRVSAEALELAKPAISSTDQVHCAKPDAQIQALQDRILELETQLSDRATALNSYVNVCEDQNQYIAILVDKIDKARKCLCRIMRSSAPLLVKKNCNISKDLQYAIDMLLSSDNNGKGSARSKRVFAVQDHPGWRSSMSMREDLELFGELAGLSQYLEDGALASILARHLVPKISGMKIYGPDHKGELRKDINMVIEEVIGLGDLYVSACETLSEQAEVSPQHAVVSTMRFSKKRASRYIVLDSSDEDMEDVDEIGKTAGTTSDERR